MSREGGVDERGTGRKQIKEDGEKVEGDEDVREVTSLDSVKSRIKSASVETCLLVESGSLVLKPAVVRVSVSCELLF